MGMVAKGAFISAKEIYGVQPKVIQDNQPLFVKKVFYTAELLTTDYEEWKLRLVSESNLGEYFSYNPVIVELEYEVNFQKYNKKVELLYAQNVEIKIKEKYYFAHEFSFSMDGKEFWLKYHESLFDMDKPWFTYQISPSLPLMIKSKIDHVQYNYAPNWGFLSLREFMDLFDLNTDKRWDDFCFWNNYDYDDSSVCGDIRIEDALELTPKTDS
jgi:hypothetical protein